MCGVNNSCSLVYSPDVMRRALDLQRHPYELSTDAPVPVYTMWTKLYAGGSVYAC